MRIVGTAGHVDHGKSSLVLSLTGHNPDRWLEERERGMTLDLGFAPLRFDDGDEAGIIDVPGHERFLHNMLAGAAGIDVLLLVIDALEGPRAQTREHLQILDLLNVRRAIVVLTKADLVDGAGLEHARRLAREACAGSVAQDSPIIAVSNVTGSGIEELKSAIREALAALPPTRDDAPAFLPVDRAFALPGHGTIVTGTLMQGAIAVGDALDQLPSSRTVRVRSLQIFGRKVKRALPGSRLAVNLAGVDVASVRRGDVLGAAGAFEATTDMTIDFTPISDALPLLQRRRIAVRVHVGAAEIEGRLVFEERPAVGRRTRTHVQLSHPTAAYRGARVIVRRLSPKDLLGGGIVTDRWSSASDDVDDRAGAESASLPDVESCLRVLPESGLRPLSAHAVAGAANIGDDIAEQALERLVQTGRAAAIAKPREYLARPSFDRAFARAEAALSARHASAPWRLGCSTREIADAIGASDALAARLLAAWHDDGRIARRSQWWRLPSFAPALTKEQRAFFETALVVDARSPLVPTSFSAVMADADAARIAGARDALESLAAAGAVTRVGDDLYRRSQYERARAAVCEALARYPSGATMAALRDALGTSRKYALPFLEHLDAEGVTVRDGDLRRLRQPRHS